MTSKIKVEGNKVTFPAILEWARVFPENMEKPEQTSNQQIKKALEATKGKYSVQVHFPDAEVLDELKSAGVGIDSGSMTKKLYPSDEYNGVGFIRLKRDGEKIIQGKNGEFDVGGAPNVYKRDEDGKLVKWDYAKDGAIGNGSKALVKVEVYNGSPRLEAILVEELVKFEGSTATSDEESFSI